MQFYYLAQTKLTSICGNYYKNYFDNKFFVFQHCIVAIYSRYRVLSLFT